MKRNYLVMEDFLVCPQCHVKAEVIALVKLDLVQIVCPSCQSILVQKASVPSNLPS